MWQSNSDCPVCCAERVETLAQFFNYCVVKLHRTSTFFVLMGSGCADRLYSFSLLDLPMIPRRRGAGLSTDSLVRLLDRATDFPNGPSSFLSESKTPTPMC